LLGMTDFGAGAGGGKLWGRRAGPRPGLYMVLFWGGLRERRTGLNTSPSRGLRIGGRGRIAVGEVLVDGIANGVAPSGGAKGVDVFMLGEVDGLGEGLGKMGEGAGGAGFDVATGDSGDDAAEGGAEIAGGEVFAGEVVRDFAGEFVGSAGLGFLAGVVAAEVGMIRDRGRTALAAVGKGEETQGHAVLIECGRRAANRAKRGHGWLLELSWK
jgi:hypothetical protein